MNDELRKESRAWFKAIAIGIMIYMFIRIFFFSNYVVQGESMAPTLEDGNKLIVNKMMTQFGELDRFDVIVFHHNERDDFVKRIIGLPGDQIVYHDDDLYINGKMIQEEFLEERKKEVPLGTKLTGNFTLEELTGEETVPEDKLFVMGDNRMGSWDGRHFGFIATSQVVGKVNICYWPLSEAGISF
ncbi:signal peptidase I [Cytobacillus purgationiresistens]|uniref:Signal peptidase I n=1 Tax=Cytobacillus purgationiresistens TaxID=863449 RepID=A0ABU0AED4_9BACI|nr:signal peptidase I [Cytobacillus purgationiresistens]MDQ0268803.1 signal peptidase I [Cytobacillus purgationiresistens]